MAGPEIGVLVPIRLETRFVAPAANQPWKLRIRVIPDAVSITNHDDRPSDVELDAVEAMWRTIGSSGLESAVGQQAWRALATRVGAERAAWLARTFPAGSPRPAQTRQEFRAPRLMGLPPTMELWMARGGAAQLAATLIPLVTDIDLDLDQPERTDQPWWTSFAEAVRVGMAAEIDLGVATPDDIDALYVVGIGAGDPGPLITAQSRSGRFGVLGPGTATSSVDGAVAASLGDADTWRRLVPLRASDQPGTASVVASLIGSTASLPSALPAVVGGGSNHTPIARAVVKAVWPALWGHSLANVAGEGSRADRLGVWAAENLVPEGPLPSMRINDTPYGLLPATSLRRWRKHSGDPAVESSLVPLVADLVDRWAARAERRAGQSTGEPLSGLIRNPQATRYAWRSMMPTTVARAVAFRHAQPIAAATIDGWWDRHAGAARRLDPAAAPARQLVSVGWARDVDLELVIAAGVDQRSALTRLAGAPIAELLASGTDPTGAHPVAPWGMSVLTELVRHSLVASAATVARDVAGQPRALVEPLATAPTSPTVMETWAARLVDADLRRTALPATAVHRNVRDGVRQLATADAVDIERSMRAALDTATHRIDPWATAIAWRRLQSLAAAPRNLGVYGWVDAPRPDPSPRTHRYLLAPSREQAVVAALLRDRAERDVDGANTWTIDLTSDTVRGALRLAADTRHGAHPAESLGQTLERIIGRPDVIDRLREAFPQGAIFPRPHFKTRRVCNGVDVLAAAVTHPSDLTQLGVTAAQLVALVELAGSVDALADLHVAEAAYGVVRGRPSAVAASTSAAAGLSPPPEFAVVKTPRDGRPLDSVVVVVLPDVAAPAGSGPTAIADGAVAAFLDDRAGDPAGANWTWATLDDTGQPIGSVSLQDIGLRPSDTVLLGLGQLRDLLREHSGTAGLGAADPAGPVLARTWAAAIAGLPALADEVGSTTDPAATVVTELAGRYAALRAAAVADVTAVRGATAPTATDTDRRAALVRAARWGITPMPTGGDGDLAGRVARAADVLDIRAATAPAQVAGLTVGAITEAIVALLAPEGGWPVFARLPAGAFAGTRAEPVGGAPSPRLDPDWIEVVAPVRPAVARLEAAQLGERVATGGRPLRAWSNHRGDPWQTAALTAATGGPQSRLVAVFGPRDVLPGQPPRSATATVAAAVIDRFAETVPARDHVASVAFPHDHPTARAPQAVLLAVPPSVEEPLTTEVLVAIVAEVRALARARMISPDDLGADAASLHLAAMPATGRTGVVLEVR